MKIYNSFSRTIEEFKPMDKQHVTMYCCGPTVYQPPHIGNARAAIVFDMLFRILRHTFGTVTYVKNITDIDDKIIALANKNNSSIEAVTGIATALYQKDMETLNVLQPTVTPFATKYVEQMKEMIAILIESGYAYYKDGNVYFSVAKNPFDGLARHKFVDAVSRVEHSSDKKDNKDFLLWKAAKANEPAWGSPWGLGRPGWHIECSAMIKAVLNKTIDIHGGGQDLRFPHHECEMAQSHCANNAPLANYWVHNAMLTYDGKKMSKSVGNVVFIAELLKKGFKGEAIRYYMMQTHYRSPMNFSLDGLRAAQKQLNSLYELLAKYSELPVQAEYSDRFINCINNDMNISGAISEMLFQAKQLESSNNLKFKSRLVGSASILGILQNPDRWFGKIENEELVESLIVQRNIARANKDWTSSDKIRKDLAEMGIEINDTSSGTTWRKII